MNISAAINSQPRSIPDLCRDGCPAFTRGWCRATDRNTFVDPDSMDDCPRDPSLPAVPIYRIIEETGPRHPHGNAEAFGCDGCLYREIESGEALCTHDPDMPRFIDWWGYCPKRPDLIGVIEGWRGAITGTQAATLVTGDKEPRR